MTLVSLGMTHPLRHCSALFVLITLPLAAEEWPSHPDSSTWPELFDAGLTRAVDLHDVWSFEDGAFSSSEDRILWTAQVYDNFIIDLEFKNGPAANGGVIVYATNIKNWVPNSVEVQMADDHSELRGNAPLSWQCGAFFGHKPAHRTKVVKQPGEWNRMTITCIDSIITVMLNNEFVNEIDLRKWTSARINPDGSEIPPWLSTPFAELHTFGHIGFQGLHGGADVFYRNIRIKEL